MKVSRSEASLNSASRLAIVLLTLSCFRCCKKCRKNVKFKAGKIPRMGEECERPSNSHGLDRQLIMVSWFSIQISRWIIKSKITRQFQYKSHNWKNCLHNGQILFQSNFGGLEGNLSSLPPSVQKIIGSLRSVGKPYSISHFTTVLLTWIVKQNLLNFAIEY